ncbi:hypothetical protein ABEB36_009190 [Hypothenemus hampei]|uniref:Uncharacterized protein n=1 Tax=Hypothenemus hampei TaxID=57062 RepID=A0ABD1EPG0_HYPHA
MPKRKPMETDDGKRRKRMKYEKLAQKLQRLREQIGGPNSDSSTSESESATDSFEALGDMREIPPDVSHLTSDTPSNNNQENEPPTITVQENDTTDPNLLVEVDTGGCFDFLGTPPTEPTTAKELLYEQLVLR